MNSSKTDIHSEVHKVSYIVTVYNKENYLPLTIKSIVQQPGKFKKEIVFADDASTDRSVEVIEKSLADYSDEVDVIIIKNKKNCGPSIRLNQACKRATGKYLHLLDSDDILAQGATELMSHCLVKEKADFCYGHYKKTELNQAELLGREVIEGNNQIVSDDPLQYVLNNKVVRMGQMITKDIFDRSGGCDERLFIQDESLPLRMAVYAKKAVFLTSTVIFAPKKTKDSLSINTIQQQHDKFFVYSLAYNDFSLPKKKKQKLLAVAVSCLWKAHKKQKKYNIYIICLYLISKIAPNYLKKDILKSYEPFMLSLTNIRRTDVFKAN